MGDKRATRNSHGAEDTSEGNDLAGVARNLPIKIKLCGQGGERKGAGLASALGFLSLPGSFLFPPPTAPQSCTFLCFV